MSRDQFYGAFKGLHQFGGGGLAKLTKNPAWRALVIQPGDEADARNTSEALYRLAELYPRALGWLIDGNNETMMCAVVIVGWGSGRYERFQQAKHYIAQQRAGQGAPKPQHQTADAAAEAQQ